MCGDPIKVTASCVLEAEDRTTFSFRSPSGRTVSIDSDSYAVQSLASSELTRLESLLNTIQTRVSERELFERLEHQRLVILAASRRKNWIADLPEYADHLKELHQRFPAIRRGEVWLKMSRDDMQLILTISKS